MPPDLPPPLVEVETPTATLWELDELDASSRAALKFTDPALWIDPSPSAEMFVPSKLASPLVVLMLRLPPDEKPRSEEHTSELQSLMRISYAVFCLKKKKTNTTTYTK